MDRAEFIKRAALGTAGLSLAGSAGRSAEAAVKPNVLLIMTDDQPHYTVGKMPNLRRLLGGAGATFERTGHAALHPGRAAALCLDGQPVGLLGELRPDAAAAFGLEEGRVAVAEVDLDALLPAVGAAGREVRAPLFLPVEQDFAVVVAEETPAAEVQRALLAGAGALATGIALFDVYRGPQVGEGRKSLAYRVTFTAPDRALTDDELGKTRARIGKVLAQRVGGELRG